ncbi:MAG: CbiX/SirB N-terminal domain-containing protein [Gemmatimonadota bacterium]
MLPPAESAPAVLLVGHGSHRSADSGRPVRELALQLRREGRFSEVRVGFWKEDPQLRHALWTVEAREVFVVPVFTSVGYFTEGVVPRELGVSEGEGPVPGTRVHYLAPVGTHLRMVDVALERAREVGWGEGDAAVGSAPGEAGEPVDLVVVGHGTLRHPDSGRVTRELVRALRSRWDAGEVRTAFLDQEPGVEEVLRGLPAPRVVVVPFFMAAGWHAGVTLPGGLGVEGGRASAFGKEVRYAEAMGTHPALARVIEEMVEEGRGGVRRGVSRASDSGAPPPARAARQAFVRWVEEGAVRKEPPTVVRSFLQVAILQGEEGSGSGHFELRHLADVGRPPAELETFTDPGAGVHLATLTAEGAHRPLRTAPDLAGGWRLTHLTPHELWEAVSHIYPGAGLHWHQGRTGSLRTTPFNETAARQTGMYADLPTLPQEGVLQARGDCCEAGCLREVRWEVQWEVGSSDPEPVGPGSAADSDAPEGGGSAAVVPCPEACSMVLERARQLLEAGR